MNSLLFLFFTAGLWSTSFARLQDRDTPTSSTGKQLLNATGNALQRNAQYASGRKQPGNCSPAEYYFTDKDNKLWRKDQGTDKPVKLSDNARAAYAAWDDSIWFVDTAGKPYRMRYNGKPEAVPQEKKMGFRTFAPVSFGEAYGLNDDGDTYRFVSNKWISVDPGSAKKTSISVGIDGHLMAADRNTFKIFVFDHATQKFKPYDMDGFGVEVYNENRILVVKDKSFHVKAKIGNGKWTDFKEQCQRLSASDVSQVYCTTPNGDVVPVHYF